MKKDIKQLNYSKSKISQALILLYGLSSTFFVSAETIHLSDSDFPSLSGVNVHPGVQAINNDVIITTTDAISAVINSDDNKALDVQNGHTIDVNNASELLIKFHGLSGISAQSEGTINFNGDVTVMPTGYNATGIDINNGGKVNVNNNLNLYSYTASSTGINLSDAVDLYFLGENGSVNIHMTEDYSEGIVMNSSSEENAEVISQNLVSDKTVNINLTGVDTSGIGILSLDGTNKYSMMEFKNGVNVSANCGVGLEVKHSNAVMKISGISSVLNTGQDPTYIMIRVFGGELDINGEMNIIGDTEVIGVREKKSTLIANAKMDIQGNITATNGAVVDYTLAPGSKIVGDILLKSYTNEWGSKADFKFGEHSILTGDVQAKKSSEGNFDFSAGSLFTGSIQDFSASGSSDVASKVTLKLDDSHWHMTDHSTLTNLTLTNEAMVNFKDGLVAEPITADTQHQLTVQNLNGNDGTFVMRTDIANNLHDSIEITDSASGHYKLSIQDAYNGSGSPTGNEVINLVTINDANDSADFTLANSLGWVDVGAWKYYLNKDDSTVANKNIWQLTGRQALTPTAAAAANILNINYLVENVETQTLLQRMGELRNNTQSEGNAWGRIYSGKLNSFDGVFDGFKMTYTGTQLGVDKAFTTADDSRLFLGAMAGFNHAKGKYRVGDAKTESYHAGIYASYYTPSQWYVDFILKYAHMRNKFNTQTGGGYQVDGKANSNGFSAGLEAGKRFYLSTAQQGWYVEPQAQFTRSSQSAVEVHSSNGLKTSLQRVDSSLGRLSAQAGYHRDGKTPLDVYVKTGYVKEFDGKTGYHFNDNSPRQKYEINGDWWDNSIGINGQIANNHNVYTEANYAKGNKFNKTQVNIGYRYSF